MSILSKKGIKFPFFSFMIKRFLAALLIVFAINELNASVNTGHAVVSLKSDLVSQNVDNFHLAINFKMDEGWHTYWSNPGDSGGPLEVSWDYPEGVIIEDVSWPTPKLIPYPPLITYGYEDEVNFVFKVFKNPSSIIENIKAKVDFLICADICIPESALLEIKLPLKASQPEIEKGLANLPSKQLKVNAYNEEEFILIDFRHDEPIRNAYFFSDDNKFNYPEKHQLKKQSSNTYRMYLPKNHSSISSFSGVLKINDVGYFINANVANVAINNSDSYSISLYQAILFALLGGIILNLMPCVFPVIAIKALSFVAGGDNNSRIHGISYTGGVLFTFLAIASVLFLFKQAGESLGWGFQLQIPEVVGFLAIIMAFLGFILLSNVNIGFSFTDKNVANKDSLFTSFSTGALAVILASPCTAPFMGAALGYAIIQSSSISFAIFGALGLGFAIPYLVLSFNPKLINLLPKPGQWMETFKQLMAFPMFATSIWLVWVFAQQTGINDQLTLWLLLLMVGLGVWVMSTFSKFYISVMLIMTMSIFAGLASIKGINNSDTKMLNLTENFEQELRKEGKPYFINFTAAWCITCKVNENTTLNKKSVKDFFKKNDVTYIEIDWTNRNADITKLLANYNRSGVPLYIFWTPGSDSPKVLPAILNESMILRLID